MDTFLSRIAKLTISMPDTALPLPVDTPRSITPNQAPSSENFALTASSSLAGWAISGLKSKVLGADGEIRPDSAPPTQSRFATMSETRRLGSQSDVDAWNDEEVQDTPIAQKGGKQRNGPSTQNPKSGMKLPVAKNSKKTVVEMVLEEEKRKSLSEENTGPWPGMEDWEDDSKDDDDGWGFDD